MKGLSFLLILLTFIFLFFNSYLYASSNGSARKEIGAISKLHAFGWDAFKEGNLNEAIFFFKKALEIDPEDLEARYGLAWIYFKQKKLVQAFNGFKWLFDKNYKKQDVAKALFFLSIKQKNYKRAKYYWTYLAKDEQKKYKYLLRKRRTFKRKIGVTKQNRNLKKLEKIFALSKKKEWTKVIPLIESLPLTLKNRYDIQKIKAWAYFNTGKIKESKNIFLRLYKKRPSKEFLTGLSLCAFKTKDLSLIKKLLKDHPYNKKLKEYLCNLKRQQLLDDFKNVNKQFVENYKLFLDAGCMDEAYKIRELLGWYYLKNKDYYNSYKVFSDLDILITRPSIHQGLMESTLGLKNDREAWLLAKRFSLSDYKEDRKIAADFYYKHNLPKRASFVYSDPSTPYFNAHSHFIGLMYNYSYIDGDAGTSKLYYQELPQLNFYYRVNSKLGAGIAIKNVLFQSGPIGESPWLGTPFMKKTITSGYSSVKGVIPSAYLEFENKWIIRGILSSSPIGGPVGALPTFHIKVQDPENTGSISFFQRSVSRSILSWVGQKDPYTGKYWGRVLSTGIEGFYNLNFRYFWLSFNARYSYLWGKEVWNNNEYSGGFSLGKTTSYGYLSDISYGIFTHLIHYDRNSNFYTYGHGGYFSPQFFVAIGPFIHLETKKGERWLIEFDGALSYLNFYEESSPLYPCTKGLPGRYLSKHSSKIGYSSHISAGYLITPQLMLGAHSGINKSADYTEWHIGVSLNFYFKPRRGLLDFDIVPDIIQTFHQR